MIPTQTSYHFLDPREIRHYGPRYGSHPGPYAVEDADMQHLLPAFPATVTDALPFYDAVPYATGEMTRVNVDFVIRAMRAVAPRLVLEVGTFTGKLTATLAQIFHNTRFVTVDCDAAVLRHSNRHVSTDTAYFQSSEKIGIYLPAPPQVVSVLADTTTREGRDRIDAALGAELVDVAIIDGGHSFDVVKNDFEQLVLPRLRVGGLVVFDDYNLLKTHSGVSLYLLRRANEVGDVFYWYAPPKAESNCVIFINDPMFARGGHR